MVIQVTDIAGGFSSRAVSLPHDWTEGTGVIPASGSITIPNPSDSGQSRKWLMIQNQSAVTISVGVQSLTALGNTVTANILIASGGGAGLQGGAQEFGLGSYKVNGKVTVTGAAGSQVLILEVLE